MTEYNFEFLDWDSEFFGLRVGKLTDANILNDSETILKSISEKEIDLVYYYTDEPLPENFSSNYYNVLLVDTKIPIILEVKKKLRNPKISNYTKSKPNKELIELAKLAGEHTRFKVDPNISQEKYEELFELWIKKSVTGEMASTVLVYTDNDQVVGFGTVLIDGDIAHAPLLAVNRSYEGRGISFAIMDAMELYIFENGCKFVVSSTQEVNKKALKIYERYGFKFEKRVFVYHLWNKKVNNLKLNS